MNVHSLFLSQIMTTILGHRFLCMQFMEGSGWIRAEYSCWKLICSHHPRSHQYSLVPISCPCVLYGLKLRWLTVCDWYCPVVGSHRRKWLPHYRLIGLKGTATQSRPSPAGPLPQLFNTKDPFGQTLQRNITCSFTGYRNMLKNDHFFAIVNVGKTLLKTVRDLQSHPAAG